MVHGAGEAACLGGRARANPTRAHGGFYTPVCDARDYYGLAWRAWTQRLAHILLSQHMDRSLSLTSPCGLQLSSLPRTASQQTNTTTAHTIGMAASQILPTCSARVVRSRRLNGRQRRAAQLGRASTTVGARTGRVTHGRLGRHVPIRVRIRHPWRRTPTRQHRATAHIAPLVQRRAIRTTARRHRTCVPLLHRRRPRATTMRSGRPRTTSRRAVRRPLSPARRRATTPSDRRRPRATSRRGHATIRRRRATTKRRSGAAAPGRRRPTNGRPPAAVTPISGRRRAIALTATAAVPLLRRPRSNALPFARPIGWSVHTPRMRVVPLHVQSTHVHRGFPLPRRPHDVHLSSITEQVGAVELATRLFRLPFLCKLHIRKAA